MHRSIHRSIHALCIHSFIRPSTHYPFLYPSVRLCCSLLYNNPTPHLISSQRTTPQRLLYFSDCFLFFSLLFFSFLFFSFRFFSFFFSSFLSSPSPREAQPPVRFYPSIVYSLPKVPWFINTIRVFCEATSLPVIGAFRIGSNRIELHWIGLN